MQERGFSRTRFAVTMYISSMNGTLFGTGSGRACANILKTDDEECQALNEEVDVVSLVCVEHVVETAYYYAGSNKNL